MATKTSVGSGLWSAAGTWDAGVPVDNDVVVIAAGHVVEFDVDQSGFANGIDGLTITGTLSLTRTAGTYYLKIKAAKTIVLTGTFDCGTSVSPIPFATKHTIYMNDNNSFVDGGGLGWTVYGAEPTIKYALLTNAESAGATVLEIDTDLTGDIWADGDTIFIANVNKANNLEERTIAVGGIAADSITITAGLTGSKLAGSVVALSRRNVRIINAASSGYVHKNSGTNKLIIGGGEWRTPFRMNQAVAMYTVSGGVFYAPGMSAYQSSVTINGGVFSGGSFYGTTTNISDGLFIGMSAVLTAGSISGGVFRGNGAICSSAVHTSISGGSFYGNTTILAGGDYKVSGGTFDFQTYMSSNAVVEMSNIQFTNTTYGLSNTVGIVNNVLMGSAQEAYQYQNIGRGFSLVSNDHNQVVGAYKAWTSGGITSSQTSVLPAGYAKGYITILGNASVEGYWQREITVGAGASVNIETQLRKDASMTYLPRAIIFNKASTDPFAGGVGLHTFTMTNSVDTWESDLYTYTNAGTEDVTLVVRIQGMNATGNMYSALLVEQINVDLTSAIAKIDVIDALVDAIKAKTDQLAFSVANQVDANSLTGGLTEGQIRTAIGLAAANLDTQLADIPTAVENRQEMDSNSTRLASIDGKTTNLPADPADQSAVEAAITAIPAGISVNDILGMQVEGTYTLQQILRIMSSALAGKLSGGGTATLKFRDLQDTLDRITATVDQATGDRDNITLDLS